MTARQNERWCGYPLQRSRVRGGSDVRCFPTCHGFMRRCLNGFVFACIWILVITGSAKLVSSQMPTKYLDERDGLFVWATIRNVILVAGIIELGLAYFVWRAASLRGKCLAILWVSCLILTYRMGLVAVHYSFPCSCLGGAADWLHLSRHSADLLMRGVLGFMLIGSMATCLLSTGYSRRSTS